MPDYGGIQLLDETSSTIVVPDWVGAATLRIGTHPAVGRLHLISVPGMARPHPYLQPSGHGWADNNERFFRFAAAVAAYVNADPPDVLHLNDWHTSTVLAAADASIPSVLSIHNLAYQGTTDGTWLKRLGPRASHYEWWGDTNPLSGGIALADRVVAVSPHYAVRDHHARGRLRSRWPAAGAGRRARPGSSTASTPRCGTRRPTRTSCRTSTWPRSTLGRPTGRPCSPGSVSRSTTCRWPRW